MRDPVRRQLAVLSVVLTLLFSAAVIAGRNSVKVDAVTPFNATGDTNVRFSHSAESARFPGSARGSGTGFGPEANQVAVLTPPAVQLGQPVHAALAGATGRGLQALHKGNAGYAQMMGNIPRKIRPALIGFSPSLLFLQRMERHETN